MNIYRRYFKVTTGPLSTLVLEANAINDIAHEEYSKLTQEVGAKVEYYHRNRQLTGFTFEGKPDNSIWRFNPRGYGYWPKQTTKWGKDLVKRIRAVKTKSVTSCLECIGLYDGPTIFGNGQAWYPTLIALPYDVPVILVSTPWYDEDPEVIDKYIIDKASGHHMNHNLDCILWKPTDEMEAIPEWEYKKYIHEWNESIKDKP